MKTDHQWEFWIDVGGTFTDCIAKDPNRTIHSCKVLSSAVVKGEVKRIDKHSFTDARQSEVWSENFFKNYDIRIIKNEEVLASGKVNSFTRSDAIFSLDFELPETEDLSYECFSHEESPLLAIRKCMGLKLDEPIGEVSVKLGTTRATNALLERKGADVALLITKGFKDLLEISTQDRPDLFALKVQKPENLYREVIEVHERMNTDGEVLEALDEELLRKDLEDALARGIKSLAIVFLHSYLNTWHEKRVAWMAKEMGFDQISVSSEISPTIKCLDRGHTAVVDAYLAPVIRSYIKSLSSCMPEANLQLMSSAGVLLQQQYFSGKDAILSGPAGGVVGFSKCALAIGHEKSIGFDMGGTSTDVSRYDGGIEYVYHTSKAGVNIVAPMVDIHTVAAGGGSICSYDGIRLLVGPGSAGADPGPACYGRGGPLTITDINFYCGKIREEHFPFPLSREIVERKLQECTEQIEEKEGKRLSIDEIAQGFLDVANLKMVSAIKHISLAKGIDPSEDVLVSFGGAGAQHACAVADGLGMKKILMPVYAGILSACGIGQADTSFFAEKSVLTLWEDFTETEIEDVFSELIKETQSKFAESGFENENNTRIERSLDMRYLGEESSLTVTWENPEKTLQSFLKAWQQRYGYERKSGKVEIVVARLKQTYINDEEIDSRVTSTDDSSEDTKTISVRFYKEKLDSPLRERKTLRVGEKIKGPAIIAEDLSTIVLDPDWDAEILKDGQLYLTKQANTQKQDAVSIERDPIRLELFNRRFTEIASQMGLILQKTSLSINVKERLDFSCAILDSAGNLVVNAPHIPVHLGAMGDSIRALLQSGELLSPGDVYLSNHPYFGGSHLPDLTVITPVFSDDGAELMFFVASRAHHAEIGGLRLGSCYPFAEKLEEEGVIFKNFKIVDRGKFLEEELRAALLNAPWPSRAVDINVADIQAAIAANHQGVSLLKQDVEQYTWPLVKAYMQYMYESAADKTKQLISRLGEGVKLFHDQMDDGKELCVKIVCKPDSMSIDFNGSGAIDDHSLNANPSIVKSAVLYSLRILIGEDIPLNEGVLDPVELILPDSFLAPIKRADGSYPAVVGGNVEVSQRIVDVILGAFNAQAASQGTMNNLIFGGEGFSYYETLAGGTGAGPDYDGCSAVHSHMTNTRITDCEILERNLPIRMQQFNIRQGSGGRGNTWGGNGVIREFEFLKKAEVSLLTQRRTCAPYGMQGGSSGEEGQNKIKRKDSKDYESLGSLEQISLNPGDRLYIATPGGGGFGLA